MKHVLPTLLLRSIVLIGIAVPSLQSIHAQIYTGTGTWKTAENWDTGAVPADGATAIINGDCEIAEDIGTANTDNPGRIIVGQGTEGILRVTGGTLSGAHGGSSGIYVGEGEGGVGTLIIEDGAALRSQGGSMVVQIGDDLGGVGTLIVAGELLNYKNFEIINGTYEMRPTGINNKFNQADGTGGGNSFIGPNGTLSFVINGTAVGTMERANTSGLNVDIDFDANLKLTLEGNFNVGDSWTLMRYTNLRGEFVQGFSFTNQQGYTFDIDYGAGQNSELIATLTSTDARPRIDSLVADPPAISAGESATVSWDVSEFDSLVLEPGIGDVSGMTTDGAGSVPVSPAATALYTLTLTRGEIVVTGSVIVVVDEVPIVNEFSITPELVAPGGEQVLRWNVDGAASVSISGGIGDVAPAGERPLTPTETTVYTLTATNPFGTSTAEVTGVVDAVLASIINRYEAAADGNTSGFFKDQVGINNFDMKNNTFDPAITSLTSRFTAANRMNAFNADTGGDALGFPGGSTSYEVWVRTDAAIEGTQVIFETGGGADGSSVLISRRAVQFLNSVGGQRTIEIEVPLAGIAIAEFIQIVATLDAASETATLYVNSTAGGSGSATAQGAVAIPNGRSTLFSHSNFNAGIAGSLGGSGNIEPEDTTQFRGEMALLNVFNRSLTADEVQIQFERFAIPDPGLITAFTASPERTGTGQPVTFSWEVGAFDTLTLDPGVGDVSGNTTGGMGSIEVTPTQSAVYTLTAASADGASIAQVTIFVNIPVDAVLLVDNADSWNTPEAWSNGLAPQAGSDYIVIPFLSGRLGTPSEGDTVFAGDSLEIRGAQSVLQLNGDAEIADLRIDGATIDHNGLAALFNLNGGLSVLSNSVLDISGSLNALALNAVVSGPGRLTVPMGDPDADQVLLQLNAPNPDFSGGWVFLGGRIEATDGSLGTGDIRLEGSEMDLFYGLDSPDASLNIQGDRSVIYANQSIRIGAINLIRADNSSVTVPPGEYTEAAWFSFLNTLDGFPADYLFFETTEVTVTVLEERPVPIPGNTFTGAGNWTSLDRWSEGLPTDGSTVVINGTAEITEDYLTDPALNPGRIYLGDRTEGTLIVSGGLLSGAHGSGGIFVGVGPGGVGTVEIAQGAGLRSQGGGMIIRIGDEEGGVGTVTVAGTLFNFKFFELINGSLIMHPTGVNNSFNSTDLSVIGANGTLAFVIDGDQVGSLRRANATGLPLEIQAGANLQVTLTGVVAVDDTWTLVEYTSLTGEFVQGTAFTNEQGHEFEIDYGALSDSAITLRVTALNPDAIPPAVGLARDGSGIVLEFTGQLQSAPSVDGPWADVNGATSPFAVTPNTPAAFYRSVK